MADAVAALDDRLVEINSSKGGGIMLKRNLMSVLFIGVVFGAQSGAAVAMHAFPPAADDNVYKESELAPDSVSAMVNPLSDTFPAAADPILSHWRRSELEKGIAEGKTIRQILGRGPLSKEEAAVYRKRGRPFPPGYD
jgi:hypothetical protein